MIKVYISGRITGCDDLNKPKFLAAEKLLRQHGYEPVNPHNILPYDPKHQWHDYMRADIKVLMDCDMVAVLDDWSISKGARLEVFIAKSLNMIVGPVEEMEYLIERLPEQRLMRKQRWEKQITKALLLGMTMELIDGPP